MERFLKLCRSEGAESSEILVVAGQKRKVGGVRVFSIQASGV